MCPLCRCVCIGFCLAAKKVPHPARGLLIGLPHGQAQGGSTVRLLAKIQTRRKLLPVFTSLCLAVLVALTSCITVTPPASPSSTERPPIQETKPAPVLPTPTPSSPLSPATQPSTPPTSPVPSSTPTSTAQTSLPPIEAFVADPSFNPGGSRLSGLGDVKVSVDTEWQHLYGQTYYQSNQTIIDTYKPYDVAQLQRVLDDLKKTPWVSLYKAAYFDCTEMSALLQRELSIRGFQSWIVIGKDPNVPIGHAWVIVFVQSPHIQLVPIEATALQIPQPGSRYTFTNGVVQSFEDYTHQGWVLQDIYQAIAFRPRGEFDWWNRTDILQKLGLPTIVTEPTPMPTPTPTPTPVPAPTPVPTPTTILQHIETPMQGVPIFGISYMNYTKYLQTGDIIDGVVQLTGH